MLQIVGNCYIIRQDIHFRHKTFLSSRFMYLNMLIVVRKLRIVFKMVGHTFSNHGQYLVSFQGHYLSNFYVTLPIHSNNDSMYRIYCETNSDSDLLQFTIKLAPPMLFRKYGRISATIVRIVD